MREKRSFAHLYDLEVDDQIEPVSRLGISLADRIELRPSRQGLGRTGYFTRKEKLYLPPFYHQNILALSIQFHLAMKPSRNSPLFLEITLACCDSGAEGFVFFFQRG